ncbi:ABC transporter ATP-binding protein [Taklimakanibacter deserti]|uniref:ABC transporter ATP-binding protein n=1 Tax=Taklimakanibacter deserti TaxID=2267839 RepID=UPI000E64F0E6
MKQVFRIFLSARDANPWLVLMCFLLSGVAEAMSVTALLPTIQVLANGDSAQPQSFAVTLIHDFLARIGLAPTLANLILVVGTFFALKTLLSFAALSYAGIAVARVITAIRKQLLHAVFDARWSFYTQMQTGRLANTMSADATACGNAYLLAAQIVTYTIQAIIYLLVALLVNWKVALFGLVVGVGITGALNWILTISKRAGYKRTDRTANITTFTTDVISNIKPLKSMERYDTLVAQLDALLRRLRKALITREVARQGLTQGSELLMTVALGIGVYLATTIGKLTLSELVVFGVIFFQVVSIVSKLQKLLQQAAENEAAYVRTEQFIAKAAAQHETHTGTLTPTLEKECRFDKIRFSHGTTTVVKDVDLSIEAGSITVLQGPSGAGKTTIVDLLIGLHTPDSGSITLDGVLLDDIDIRQWRRSIGYVPQELSLLHSTVRQNLTLGNPAISDDLILSALDQAGARDFVMAMPKGLDTEVGSMGQKLSGGERQRIALARALVTKPKLLILDEVTSALDPKTEESICNNILSLRGKYTVVAITHRPAWAHIATHLYKVEHGTVAKVTRSDLSPAKSPAANKIVQFDRDHR